MNLLFISPDSFRRSLIKTVATARFSTLSCTTRATIPSSYTPYDVLVFPVNALPLSEELFPQYRIITYGPIECMPQALMQGCVDYLVEPWEPEELFYRALRFHPVDRITLSGIVHLVLPGCLKAGTHEVPLTAIEYSLLVTLLKAKGSIVPRSVLSTLIPGPSSNPSSRKIDAHMARLRKKIHLCREGTKFTPGNRPRPNLSPIRAARGLGYYLITD